MKDYKRLTEGYFECSRCEKGICESPNSLCKDSLYCEIHNRLFDLEDKIERGEFVEVPKGAVVLTPEVRKQAVREFLKLLKEKESPKPLMWEYGEGYLDCIKTTEELAAQYSVEVEE